MLAEKIRNSWELVLPGNILNKNLLATQDYEAFTFREGSYFGVAFPVPEETKVNENFANVSLQNRIFRYKDKNSNFLTLMTKDKRKLVAFSYLCEAFVTPGNNGEFRGLICQNPSDWWKEWKGLLGNKDVNARIYDVLGELISFRYILLKECQDAEWLGPRGASYDIQVKEKEYVEVKSTLSRSKKTITVSNQFQLNPPDGGKFRIFHCTFESSEISGYTIDSLIEELKAEGYNTSAINENLNLMGFEDGMSARRKPFILQAMESYNVDESFPRISRESFIGGDFPRGITHISYDVDLSGLDSVNLLAGD